MADDPECVRMGVMRSTTAKFIEVALIVVLVLAGEGLLLLPRASATAAQAGRAATCEETPLDASLPHRLVLVVGASFTAGIGPDKPSLNWAVRLGELLDWRTVTLGVPGEGYSEPGLNDSGPLLRLFRHIDLASLHPNLIIVQAGHDDWRTSAPLEAQRVAALLRYLEGEAPYARLAFITAFSAQRVEVRTSGRVSRANSTIMRVIAAADPRAIIINPYDWRFPRVSDGLHPTSEGDLIIARHVLSVLASDGAASTSALHSSVKVTCMASVPRVLENP
jgi:lysophospholipase L1-like esterase